MAAELDRPEAGTRAPTRRLGRPYDAPAGGWGSVKSLARIADPRARIRQRAAGSDCGRTSPTASSASAAPGPSRREPHPVRVLRERRQGDRVGDHHASASTPSSSRSTRSRELESWPDHDLEEQGRLTAPDALGPRHRPLSCRSTGRRPSRRSARSCKALDPKRGGVLRLRPRLARNVLHVRSCSRGSTAPTTCPTARTCATRAPRWRCPRASACRSARSRWRISSRPTASSSSARTSAPTARACCTSCRTRRDAACRSSPSIRCASAGSSASSTRRRRARC